jgi:hypothetical protein
MVRVSAPRRLPTRVVVRALTIPRVGDRGARDEAVRRLTMGRVEMAVNPPPIG